MRRATTLPKTLVLLCVLLSPLNAEPVCQVRNPVDGSAGSGTHIDTANGRGLIATVWHIFRDAPVNGAAVNLDGNYYRGEVIAHNRALDLCLISIPAPPSAPARIGVAGHQDTFTTRGYGHGGVRFASAKGRMMRVINTGSAPAVILSNDVEGGDSGGGCFNGRDEWVGVIWGRDYERGRQGNAYVSIGKPVGRWLLTQCGPNGCCPGYRFGPAAAAGAGQLAEGQRTPTQPRPPQTTPVPQIDNRRERPPEPPRIDGASGGMMKPPSDADALDGLLGPLKSILGESGEAGALKRALERQESQERRLFALEKLLAAGVRPGGSTKIQLPQAGAVRPNLPAARLRGSTDYLRLLLLQSDGVILVDQIITARAMLNAAQNNMMPQGITQ